MILNDIEKVIEDALKRLNLPAEKILLEHPADLARGDYSTNIAMVLAKRAGKKPKELAERIVKQIHDSRFTIHDSISKIEVAGAGFINFYLSPKFFVESVRELSEKVELSVEGKKEKVVVEYTDPNPFKEFHIGHLMTNTIGEAIARVEMASGAEVKKACYQGDVGMHVAKAIWGALMMEKRGEKVDWGRAYARGSADFEKDKSAKDEIEKLNKKIYERTDEEVNVLYDQGKKYSLEKFEEIYKKLGTKFDFYFFESQTGSFGKKVVEENIGKFFEKSDGAVIFKGENYGLHTRVFINSEGLPTYEAKDLGLAKIKFDKFPYDKSVVVTGNEINDYFQVILRAMGFIFPDLASRIKHIGHGMLRLPSGKMSSRTGEVITGESLIEKVKGMVLEKIKDREFSDSEKQEVAEKVAIGAIKFSILKSATGSDIIFDFDKSISFEGDSGPYLQYSYARAVSVLRKAGQIESRIENRESRERENEELERRLYRFSEIVARAKEELEPHYVAGYLIEIAGAFNSFYAKNKILDAGDDTPYRLMLTKAFSKVMEKGLWLLGISVLERM